MEQSPKGAGTIAASTPNGTSTASNEPWWKGAVGYEVYIRSFADSNGDGIGDLAGVIGKLDYLSWLGVDIVWLTPFYPSPCHDHGYDVSDYCGVAGRHGTIEDFDELVKEVHRRGMRIMVDVVPNHTSIEHPWFTFARHNPSSPERQRYIWADPAPNGGPPNNWLSHFGGPAWTLDEASGQYWCHLFLPEQPDLNWRSPAVRDEFDAILRWWIERGVDGFRVDVAHGLIKDAELRDNPQTAPLHDSMHPFEAFAAFEHRHDMDQPSNIEIFERWKQVCEPHQVMLLGEVNAPWPDGMARYVAAGALDQAFFLRTAIMGWDPGLLLQMVRSMHDAAPEGVSWVVSNHDRPRPVTRFGGGEAGLRRSLAVSTLFMALGGTPFLYQGEELGLADGVLRGDHYDPVAIRDGCRTPMPWDAGPQNGFSSGAPWIDSELRPDEQTVAAQRNDPLAPVHHYRSLLAMRRSHPDMWRAPLQWLESADPLVAALRRGSILVIANMSAQSTSFQLDSSGWQIVYASHDSGSISQINNTDDTVLIPAETTLVFKTTSAG